MISYPPTPDDGKCLRFFQFFIYFILFFFFWGVGFPISQPNYSKEYKKNISIAANLYYYNVQYGVVHVWISSYMYLLEGKETLDIDNLQS